METLLLLALSVAIGLMFFAIFYVLDHLHWGKP